MGILDLKTVASDIGPRELVEAWVLQVENLAAVQADQVMVLLEFGVEPGGRAGMTNPGKEAERDECPQNAMDRHPGDLGESDADGPVNLLRRRMVVASEDGFKYGPALVGDRQAFLAMCGKKPIESLLLVRCTHLSRLDIHIR